MMMREDEDEDYDQNHDQDHDQNLDKNILIIMIRIRNGMRRRNGRRKWILVKKGFQKISFLGLCPKQPKLFFVLNEMLIDFGLYVWIPNFFNKNTIKNYHQNSKML